MNIAIISPEYPPHTNWGGVATFNDGLASVFARLGYHVHVITFDGRGEKEREKREGNITIHYVPYKTRSRVFNMLYYKLFGWTLRRVLCRYFPRFTACIDWNVFSLIFFVKQQKRTPFRVIHCPTYSFPSLFISLLYKQIPTILYAHGPQEFFNRYEPTSADNTMMSVIENWYLQHCSLRILACSVYMQRLVQKRFPKIRSKVVYQSNFIDTKGYDVSSPLNKNNIVFWGRLEQRKGVDVLIRAFISLAKTRPKLKLYLIGDSSGTVVYLGKHTSVQDYMRTLNIPPSILKRVIMYPRIDDKRALVELLESIKGIAVFPSRMEPFGLVVIEAMALGYITLASTSGGGKEIITNKWDGILMRPTYRAVRRALLHCFLLSPAAVKSMTTNAQKTVDGRFSIKSALLLSSFNPDSV